MRGKWLASRREVLAGLAAGALSTRSLVAGAKPLQLEKEQIKLGFIKLTDMAPLAMAYEKGYFEDEGLYVTLEPQANWKVLLDRVIDGELDGAHMLAGQPLGATIGIGTKADVITAFSMDLNGNAITVSNAVWELMKPGIPKDAQGLPEHPINASALKPVIRAIQDRGQAIQDGHGVPGVHAQLRAALLAGGRRRESRLLLADDVTGQIMADVLLSVTPPPQMPATLEAGTINGYCVGEPWNQQAHRSRRWACRWSPTTRSGRTIRRKCSASPRHGRTSTRTRTSR